LINFGPRHVDASLEFIITYLRGCGVDFEGINFSSVSADLLDIYDKNLEAWLDRYARTAQTPEAA